MFDEPEAGIDLWSFDGLISAFSDNKNNGGTNIIISHQEKILEIADKILVMDGGEVKNFGNARFLFGNSKFAVGFFVIIFSSIKNL